MNTNVLHAASLTAVALAVLLVVPGTAEPQSVPSEVPTVPSEPQSVPGEVPTVPSEPQSVPNEVPTVPSEPQSVPSEVPTVPSTVPANPNQPVAPPPVTQIEYTVITGVIPEAAVTTVASGTLGSVTLNVTLNLSLLFPAGLFSGQGQFAAGYNVYVAALVPIGRMGLPAAAWFMLPSTRSWTQLASPIAAYLENVAQSATVSIDILQNMDMTQLVGTEFYVGYGLSDQEMLTAGRFRGVYIAR